MWRRRQYNTNPGVTYSSMVLVGNISSLLSKESRSFVLKKINSKGTPTSLAAEEYAKKNLLVMALRNGWRPVPSA